MIKNILKIIKNIQFKILFHLISFMFCFNLSKKGYHYFILTSFYNLFTFNLKYILFYNK